MELFMGAFLSCGPSLLLTGVLQEIREGIFGIRRK